MPTRVNPEFRIVPPGGSEGRRPHECPPNAARRRGFRVPRTDYGRAAQLRDVRRRREALRLLRPLDFAKRFFRR